MISEIATGIGGFLFGIWLGFKFFSRPDAPTESELKKLRNDFELYQTEIYEKISRLTKPIRRAQKDGSPGEQEENGNEPSMRAIQEAFEAVGGGIPIEFQGREKYKNLESNKS